jgi:hypothetical protein
MIDTPYFDETEFCEMIEGSSSSSAAAGTRPNTGNNLYCMKQCHS